MISLLVEKVLKNKGNMWLYVVAGGESEELSKELASAAERSRCQHGLVMLKSENWNDELSPWKAAPAFGKKGFGGKGEETLRWLREKIIPETEGAAWQENRRIIGGYSLAGLFSLWTFYETELFQGVFSCSGSLWFPGWQKYVEDRSPVGEGNVYLSLGKKEEMTRNAMMKSVGDMTRAQYQILKQQLGVSHCILEWNEGGHFEEPNKRIIRAVEWVTAHENSLP